VVLLRVSCLFFVCGVDVEELVGFFWLCSFVVLRGGFHGGADTGSFVVVLVVVFGGDVRGGWCWFLVIFVVVNGSFGGGDGGACGG